MRNARGRQYEKTFQDNLLPALRDAAIAQQLVDATFEKGRMMATGVPDLATS